MSKGKEDKSDGEADLWVVVLLSRRYWSSPSNAYEFLKLICRNENTTIDTASIYWFVWGGGGGGRLRTEILDILDWPKCLFGFFRNIVRKSPKYIFSQLNISNRIFDLTNLGGNG